jgi:hypothetical protein
MGYLSNSTVTIDAILTTKGREKLAKGNFKPTQFALADDEIDYTLYNPSHLSGSAFYGEAIENMPLLEAIPSENQIMKYKLITLPRGTAKMPILSLGYTAVTLKQGASISITPQTLNYLGEGQLYESSGYTAIISDVRLLNSFNASGIDTVKDVTNQFTTIGTNVSKTVVGTTINLKATTVNTLFGTNTQLNCTLTIIGRDSGARITIPVTITKVN